VKCVNGTRNSHLEHALQLQCVREYGTMHDCVQLLAAWTPYYILFVLLLPQKRLTYSWSRCAGQKLNRQNTCRPQRISIHDTLVYRLLLLRLAYSRYSYSILHWILNPKVSSGTSHRCNNQVFTITPRNVFRPIHRRCIHHCRHNIRACTIYLYAIITYPQKHCILRSCSRCRSAVHGVTRSWERLTCMQ
jgi:hypothetical protein